MASWADRAAVQALRRYNPFLLDGGLFELLHWPVYHVHKAVVEGQVVGYAAVGLMPEGVADDFGLAVLPTHRRQGVASKLRACQARDLQVMGWQRLYVAIPADQDAAVAMCTQHFGPPLGSLEVPGLPVHLYFGAPLDDLVTRLPRPYPLTTFKDTDYLRQKGERVQTQLAQLGAHSAMNTQKAHLRG
jgi:GNAT superfamily N-acetyltransferase